MTEHNNPPQSRGDEKRSNTLFAKMSKILGVIETIPKRGRNAFYNYDYVMERDLVDSIRPMLAQEGIAFFISCEGSKRTEIKYESRGKEQTTYVTTADLIVTFADSETGETFTVRWQGEGADASDKGLYKAYTGGLKYLLMKTFLVPTGDDPEQDDDHRSESRQVPPKAPVQAPPVNATTKLPQTWIDGLRTMERNANYEVMQHAQNKRKKENFPEDLADFSMEQAKQYKAILAAKSAETKTNVESPVAIGHKS